MARSPIAALPAIDLLACLAPAAVLGQAALGAPDAATRVRSFVPEIQGSLEWATPGASSWRLQLQGAATDGRYFRWPVVQTNDG